MADELELLEGLTKEFDSYKSKTVKQMAELKAETKEQIEKAEKDSVKALAELKAESDKAVEAANKIANEQGQSLKQLQEEVLELKAKKSRFSTPQGEGIVSAVQLLKDAFAEHDVSIKAAGNQPQTAYKFAIKAAGDMTIANNLTGNGVAIYSPTPAVRGRQKLHYRDLVSVVPSATGIWKFYRQNKPTGEGSFLTQTPGALKSQVDYDVTEVTVTTGYLAGYVRIAKQMLQDLPFMQSFVSEELVEDYLRAEDYKFFQQLIAAANGNIAGVTSTVTIEKIIQQIAALSEDDYDTNGIVVTNAVWAKILNTKPNDYSLPGGSAVTVNANGDVMVVGVPLLKTKESYIGNNRIIMGDWSKAKIIQTEGLSVNMYEQDQDNVVRNLITIKAEARVDQAILRTDAFAYLTAGTT